MTDASELASIPPGYGTVTPWVISRDTTALMAFIVEAFGGAELSRLKTPEGRIVHAEMRIGTSIVMFFDKLEGWPDRPAYLRLFLEDSQATFDKALAAGATEITRPTRLSFGSKVGRVRDPFGNVWWLEQRVEEVDEAELARRWNAPEWAEAMDYVQRSLRVD